MLSCAWRESPTALASSALSRFPRSAQCPCCHARFPPPVCVHRASPELDSSTVAAPCTSLCNCPLYSALDSLVTLDESTSSPRCVPLPCPGVCNSCNRACLAGLMELDVRRHRKRKQDSARIVPQSKKGLHSHLNPSARGPLSDRLAAESVDSCLSSLTVLDASERCDCVQSDYTVQCKRHTSVQASCLPGSPSAAFPVRRLRVHKSPNYNPWMHSQPPCGVRKLAVATEATLASLSSQQAGQTTPTNEDDADEEEEDEDEDEEDQRDEEEEEEEDEEDQRDEEEDDVQQTNTGDLGAVIISSINATPLTFCQATQTDYSRVSVSNATSPTRQPSKETERSASAAPSSGACSQHFSEVSVWRSSRSLLGHSISKETAPRRFRPFRADMTRAAVTSWLRAAGFASLQPRFSKFSGMDMLRLTRRDLIILCGTSEGIRLSNALLQKLPRANCTVYIRRDGESTYHALYLYNQTEEELRWRIASSLSVPMDNLCALLISSPTDIMINVTDEFVSQIEDQCSFMVTLHWIKEAIAEAHLKQV